MVIYAMSDIHGMYGSFMRRIKQLDNLKSVKAGKDKLILLGDYIDVGNNSFKVLKAIYELQQDAGKENMIVLMGNHDKWFIGFLEGKNDGWIYGYESIPLLEPFLDEAQIDGLNHIINKMDPGKAKSRKLVKYINDCLMQNHKELFSWYKQLPLYYKTDTQIFVHAGIDEEAGDLWEFGTSEDMFTDKYPATQGNFYMDIIAGHVSTSTASRRKANHDIYYDGKSHFFIDGIDSYPRSVRDDDRIIPVLAYNEYDGCGLYYSLQEDGKHKILKYCVPSFAHELKGRILFEIDGKIISVKKRICEEYSDKVCPLTEKFIRCQIKTLCSEDMSDEEIADILEKEFADEIAENSDDNMLSQKEVNELMRVVK